MEQNNTNNDMNTNNYRNSNNTPKLNIIETNYNNSNLATQVKQKLPDLIVKRRLSILNEKLELLKKWNFKNLTIYDLNPINFPIVTMSTLIITILLSRYHYNRYLLIKNRNVRLFSMFVNYSIVYFVAFNLNSIYNHVNVDIDLSECKI